jgi:hypothetical protein
MVKVLVSSGLVVCQPLLLLIGFPNSENSSGVMASVCQRFFPEEEALLC